MTEIHTGGCHCGRLRYAFEAPLRDIAHCHCSICRRTTGGIVTTWLTLPMAGFRWTHGSAAAYASSASCTRYFCAHCGCHLTLFTSHSPDSLDITVASLDHPERAPADRHIWTGSRLPWLRLDEGLPEEDEERL
ncbi:MULTISPECIES: GFA family protein [unclassified Pseudomonas]|uniref:GFA family protein n=1 Tax=unclassified Pseudomonas TaxID=196821 RepID=UPI00244B6CFE|nr:MULTISPECIES: GFA family protein [unclassified Pseudomonas]MDG9930170.1 GFA family protein [Pseudomonas sp. GD04042]MDH0485918.1 GFA family protein [Pseudomonas sp. GD04015]MDH0606794.1 GFA family protein [Pseudomonas sp. GD03869]